MPHSSVSFLVDKITLLLQEEVNLQRGVRDDVQYIKGELERHQAILMVADSSEDKDPELKVWVKNVRDIAHEMEDAIDEYDLGLVDHEQGNDICYFEEICFHLKTLKARHNIASDIKRIKSKVQVISERHPNISKESSSSSQRLSSRLDCQGDALLLEEADLVGIEQPKKEFCDLLFKDGTNRVVISIYGMGGLGKTTLAKQVYDDPNVKKYFKIHAWVNLSQSSKIEELLKDLVQQLHILIGKPVPKAIGMMKSDELKQLIKNLLLRSRYLIVLDDVWNVTLWNAVKLALPNNNLGSRVILTTRKINIASSYSGAELSREFHLKFLPTQDAWSLFCRKTFQGEPCPSHLEEECRKILKLCGGLPLAIVAISGVLAIKERSNIEEWNMVCKSFGSQIESNEDTRRVVSLSFNELPYYLKSCLLYLSIFPEFHAIEHMRLIRLWIAEGFVNGEGGRTPEEVADSYLKELLNKSLLQVVEKTSDGRMKTCRMHGLLREIVNIKSRDQNFATIAREQEQDIEWTEQVRRLSIINSCKTVLKQNKTIFKLRSLLMFALSDSLSHFSIHELCSSTGVNLLKVLDLQDAPLEAFPAEIVDLYLLKYLSLKNTKVKSIPCSIKKLQNLETLDLKHTYVTELPAEIVELKRLRHLLVYRYEIESYARFHAKHGFKVAAPIGNMQSLQKLCYIEVDQGSGALMAELGKLTQLRRLGIQKLRKEDGVALCSSIEKMINLRSLSISAIEEDEVLDIHDITKPPPYLQRLYLSGCLEKFPQWIKSCKNLVRVFLKWSRLKEDPLVFLQGLPNLRHLELLQVYVGETLHFNAKGFPRLKVLGLDDLQGLKCMIIDEGAMQGLKKLIIQQCGSLKHVPVGIEYLTKLKTIDFFDMPDELLTALRPNIGREFWRVQNVPTVYTTYWRDGGWDVYSLETFGERATDSDDHSNAMRLRTLELPILWKV
ncbi:hypothetical protein TSUD_235220 [Trifolium subterraneum]|uniref:AAA+ ATPase domain-containing protein n=1 Tax=Trifolium subterraneum TaxID=3900 RepID=A0A2Z6NKH2_TRISU|nr:hypothetical protein TSUD_235220 [Trifolium subterraneum]